MSRFNLPTTESKSLDNYVNTEKSDNKDFVKVTNIPEFVNFNRNMVNSNFIMENHPQSNVIYVNDDELDIKKICLNTDHKKLMNKKNKDDKPMLISNINDNNDEIKFDAQLCVSDLIDSSENESIPLVNIMKYNKNSSIINNSQTSSEQYRNDSFLPKKIPARMFVNDTSNEISSISSMSNVYNFNGFHLNNRIKNASSFGSSFITNNIHQQALFSIQNTQPNENNDIRNPIKTVKSQSVFFTQQPNDFVDQNIDEDFQASFVNNTKKTHLKNDSNNMQIINPSKIFIPCSVDRREAILVKQPECYESDIFPKMTEMCVENIGNHSTGELIENNSGILRENLVPVEYIYPNNCYLPPYPIHEHRKSMSYISQQVPIQLISVPGSVVLNSNSNPNFRNANAYSRCCLAPIPQSLVAYSTNKTKDHNFFHSDKNVKHKSMPNTSESFISRKESLDESQLFYTTEPIISQQTNQQFSSNNELNRINNNFHVTSLNDSIMSNTMTSEEPSIFQIGVQAQSYLPIDNGIIANDQPIVKEILSGNKKPPENNTSTEVVKKIGKFMVTPATVNVEPTTVFKSTENRENSLNYSQNMQNYFGDDIPKLDRPQQHSRFKKTRIRETVERWSIHGLNTYDCRVKIIPAKFMNLYQSQKEYFSKEVGINHNCTKCDTHDKEKYCYEVDYHKKEFKFWHNGNHIDLCSELEENIENYCQFHAKILKLLNQNQNLSLSKSLKNSFDVSENINLASPQLFQTVLISSPDHENYIINIDTQSSHVLLSAPPVSPSVMNTASISSLPNNIQSPRSATTMVMLKCATPVMLANATRNATLLNESISIEKINHKQSSNFDSDSNLCGQQILANEGSSIIDLWQSTPMNSEQLAFKLSSPTYVAGTVIADNSNIDGEICNHPHSLYSIGHMSPLYYPIYQQPMPSISSTMITNKCHDHNSFLSNIDEYDSSTDNLPDEIIQEINKTINLFKSSMINIFQSDHNKLINEIKHLRKSNEQLASELLKMKSRSDTLENLLKDKQDQVGGSIRSSDISGQFDRCTNIDNSNSQNCSPDFQRSEFDYNNLI